ncbi:hypothetical protein TNCV_3512801 [Trichonephila clavipes]|nr:hypothetical protein TNCV_3512801 [Trichonephila clavipes]
MGFGALSISEDISEVADFSMAYKKHHPLGEFSIGVEQCLFPSYRKCQRNTLEENTSWFVADHCCRDALAV